MHRTTINNFFTGENMSHISQFRQYLTKSWWKRKISYSGYEECEHYIKWISSNVCIISYCWIFMSFAGRFKISPSIWRAARGSSLIFRPMLTRSREQHFTLAPLSVVSKSATEVQMFLNYLHVQFKYGHNGKWVVVYMYFSALFSFLVLLLAQDFQLDRNAYA